MTFIKDECGQSMVEYALVIGSIAVLVIVILVVFGPKIRDTFNKSNNALDEAN